MCKLIVFCEFSIHRAALWILGEYCTGVEDISRVLSEVRTAIGEVRWVVCYVYDKNHDIHII